MIKIEYWSGRKKEIFPEGKDLDQVRSALSDWISLAGTPRNVKGLLR